MKQTIRLNESDLYHIIKEALDELNWKSYANAAKKRLQQSRETDEPEKQKELWDKYYELAKAANQAFDDEFVGNWKYDTMGAKLKGKHSPRFSAFLHLSNNDMMPYGAINGYNKGGDKIFSTDKGTYHSTSGIVSPGRFFRDADVASAFKKANDELWDYNADKYRYEKGKGWIKGEDDEEKLDEVFNPVYEPTPYMGCKNVHMIWHGEHADPELECNGFVCNYYTIENTLCIMAKEEGINPNNNEEFANFVRENEYYVCELIQEYGQNKEEGYDELDEAIARAIHKLLK